MWVSEGGNETKGKAGGRRRASALFYLFYVGMYVLDALLWLASCFCFYVGCGRPPVNGAHNTIHPLHLHSPLLLLLLLHKHHRQRLRARPFP